jgi:hypothetical protein
MAGLYDRIQGIFDAFKNNSSSGVEHSQPAPLTSAAAAASKFDELSRILGRGLSNQNVPESLEHSQDEEAPENSLRNSYLPRLVPMNWTPLLLDCRRSKRNP